jgi:hypothetical protein
VVQCLACLQWLFNKLSIRQVFLRKGALHLIPPADSAKRRRKLPPILLTDALKALRDPSTSTKASEKIQIAIQRPIAGLVARALCLISKVWSPFYSTVNVLMHDRKDSSQYLRVHGCATMSILHLNVELSLKAGRLRCSPETDSKASIPGCIESLICRRYPEKARLNQHRAHCLLPLPVAHVLRHDPQVRTSHSSCAAPHVGEPDGPP